MQPVSSIIWPVREQAARIQAVLERVKAGHARLTLLPRSVRFFVPAVLLLSLLASACLSETPPLRAGVTLPLSGMGAEYGEAFRRGIEMALFDSGASARSVRFLFEDDAYDGKRTVAAMRKWVSAGEVDLLFVWGITPSGVAASVAEQLKVPTLISTVNADARGKEFTINFSTPLDAITQTFGRFLKDKGYKKIGLATAQLGALEQFSHDLRAALSPPQRIAFQQTFGPDLLDFRSLLLKLKRQPCDVLGALLTPEQIPIFFEQAEILQYNPPVFGAETFASEEILAKLGRRAEGIVFFDWYVDPAFERRYRLNYGTVSHVPEAGKGYLLAQILMKIASQGRSRDASALLNSVREIPPGASVAGRYRFTDYPAFGPSISFEGRLKQVQQGRVVDLPEYSTAHGEPLP